MTRQFACHMAMKPALLLLLGVLSAGAHVTSVQAQLPQAVSEAELRALVPGRSMTTVNSRGQTFRETYAPDGRLNATSTRMDGSCCIADSGRWEIEAGQFCRQYDNWNERRRFCVWVGRIGPGYVNMNTGVPMEFSRP
jgi:hypothetical protein